MLTEPSTGPSPSEQLHRAHRRFARAALALYGVAAAVSVAVLSGLAADDRGHEVELQSARLLRETQLRAHQLARQLGLVVGELRRLGLRSEVDLLDAELGPEKSLLRLSHTNSTFFNVGVAIIDAEGRVMWSEPAAAVVRGGSVAAEPWFDAIRRRRSVAIVPVEPERASDSLIYVVSPIIRNDAFTGALLGAIDLARAGPLDLEVDPTRSVQLVLSTLEGQVVYPPKPPPFAAEPGWRRLFLRSSPEPATADVSLGGVAHLAAAAPVTGADLVLLGVVSRRALEGPADARMLGRLALGLTLAVVPFGVLLFYLRRSLATFRAAEDEALRQGRLQLVGEAANLIAHEVKNGLNGLRMGLDVLTQGHAAAGPRVVERLRDEMTRLSQFASDLMLFSKGVAPRIAPLELGELVDKVVALARDTAEESGVALDLAPPPEPLRVVVDPGLVHVAVLNLITNAVDAVSAEADRDTPRVEISVGPTAGFALVRVRDHGPGVSAEVRDRLFEPFVTGKPNGVGIGLALSRQIARAHGGDLVLEDTPEGASFVLTLPREDA